MTMLCWVYHYGQDGPLFNYKTSGNWGVHLWVVAGQLFVRFTKRDYSFTNALLKTHLAGGWKFVGASYDGGSGDAKLWVNGAVVQTLNIRASLDLATQDNIRMGVKTGDGRYFKGKIAQMQVYSSALSQEQIVAIYKRIEGKTVLILDTFQANSYSLFPRTLQALIARTEPFVRSCNESRHMRPKDDIITSCTELIALLIKFQILLPSTLSMPGMVPRRPTIVWPKGSLVGYVWLQVLTVQLAALMNLLELQTVISSFPTLKVDLWTCATQ